MRESTDYSVYRARVSGTDAKNAVLQVISGETLSKAGGSPALLAWSQRLAGIRLDGVAPVIDYGDLADAFFLVTAAPDGPTVPECLSETDREELSIELDAITSSAERIIQAGRDARVPLRFESSFCFVDECTGSMTLTPPLLVEEFSEEQSSEASIVLVAGADLGPFILVEPCGEGGFGEVWKARQERPVQRNVAVKILKEDFHSQRARARFEIEQQALAQLDHPHIARFFEGGTTGDGRPFFAMEWIDGDSITRFCEIGNAPLVERLRLFHQVGEAIHHAHQKGLIHRDLKPSNVMVTASDGEASAKVIDFGIARALEYEFLGQTQLTRAEEIVGTPASMSPEQAAGAGFGNLDARTDVYGLGVLLYELLTGHLPFDPKLASDELRRLIREEDPRQPSRRMADPHLERQVKGDLDWIVMRCLEKDPDRRYASVSALLRDLERHANNEPVEAGPPEWSYKVRKFIRRNRVAVYASILVLFSLLAGLVAALTGYQHAQRARVEADFEADRATKTVAYLKRAFFTQLDPAQNANPNVSFREVLRLAGAQLATDFSSWPDVEVELRLSLGLALKKLADFEAAEPHFRRAAALAADHSNAGIEARVGLAETLNKLGRMEDALAVQDEVLAILSDRGEDQSPRYFEALFAKVEFLRDAGRNEESVALSFVGLERSARVNGASAPATVLLVDDLVFVLTNKAFSSLTPDRWRILAAHRNAINPQTVLASQDLTGIRALRRLDLVDARRLRDHVWARYGAELSGSEEPSFEAIEAALTLANLAYPSEEFELILETLNPVWEPAEARLQAAHPLLMEASRGFLAALFMTGERERSLTLARTCFQSVSSSGVNLDGDGLNAFFQGYAGVTSDFHGTCKFLSGLADTHIAEWVFTLGCTAALGSNDPDAFAQFVDYGIRHFGESQDPNTQQRLARFLLRAELVDHPRRDRYVTLGIDLAKKAFVASGERPVYFVAVGYAHALLAEESYTDAIEELDRLIERDRDHFFSAEAFLLRSLANARSGSVPRAIEDLREAKRLLDERSHKWFFRHAWDYFVYQTLLLDHACREIEEAGLEGMNHFQEWWPPSDTMYQEMVGRLSGK